MTDRSWRIVIIDNYDSYAYNLYQRIGEIVGVAPRVFRNDRVTLDEVCALAPTHLVISPGPGNPENPAYFGVCCRLVLELGPRLPVLGVCLGHQGIGFAFGGRVIRAPAPMHGKSSRVKHDGSRLFRGLDSPLVGMRYHSLVLDPDAIPDALRVTAWTDDGIVMGFAHKEFPIFGVQFHPESIGTPQGIQILRNFLEEAA
ncbi:MAG: aminodeoxychorismate/anthranilate synthase component II [Deltaproteobacteria bacterium]|nr:MAG: aminodeoxychorismate/anthranilate synthase component II [Deltaproteobacteria bacterium]